MSREEAKALYEAKSDKLTFRFTSYYKYSFDYVGEVEGLRVSVTYGGNSDDIYRYSVGIDPRKAPKTFDELMNNYFSVTITNTETNDQMQDYH